MTVRPIRKFTEMLGLLDRGEFDAKCDEHLAAALQTLDALPRGSGKATITLTIAIAYDSGRLDIHPIIKSKLPEEAGFGRTPFWSYDGALSTQHPSQIDLFAAPAPAARKTAAE